MPKGNRPTHSWPRALTATHQILSRGAGGYSEQELSEEFVAERAAVVPRSGGGSRGGEIVGTLCCVAATAL